MNQIHIFHLDYMMCLLDIYLILNLAVVYVMNQLSHIDQVVSIFFQQKFLDNQHFYYQVDR